MILRLGGLIALARGFGVANLLLVILLRCVRALLRRRLVSLIQGGVRGRAGCGECGGKKQFLHRNSPLVWRFGNSPGRMEGTERISESSATRANHESSVLFEFEVRSERDPITWRTSNSAH